MVDVRIRVSLPQAASLRQALAELLGALDLSVPDNSSLPAASPPLHLKHTASSQPCGLVQSERTSQRESFATVGAAQSSTPRPAAQTGVPTEDSSEIAAKLNGLREAAHYGHTRSYQQAARRRREMARLVRAMEDDH